MTKFKVIPIAMTVKNNGIAKSGEIVDESQLNSPTAELLKDGFIRHLTEEELSELKQPESVLDIVDESQDDSEEVSDQDNVDSKEEVEDVVETENTVSAKDNLKNKFKK